MICWMKGCSTARPVPNTEHTTQTFLVVVGFHLMIRVFEVSKTTRILECAVTLIHYS